MEPKLTLAKDFLASAYQWLGLQFELLYQHFKSKTYVITLFNTRKNVYVFIFGNIRYTTFLISTTQSPNHLVSLFFLIYPQSGIHM